MAGDAWVTIDELAHEVGVTVRQVRSHQSRGLLPPPDVRARTGFYGPEHRARLALITELQAEGVKLDTVRRLLATTGEQTSQLLDFARGVRTLFAQPRAIASAAELAARFRTTDRDVVKRARRLGLLRTVAPDSYEEISPRLTAVGEQLVGLGVPAEDVLSVAESLRRHVDGLAKAFVTLYLDSVWAPFEAAGRPEDGWPRMHAALAELRTVAGEATAAALELAMAERLDVAFGRDLAKHVRVASADPA